MKIKSIVAALGVALSLAAGSASAQQSWGIPGAYTVYHVTITQTHEVYPPGGGKPKIVKDYVTLPRQYTNLKDCLKEVKRIKEQIGSLDFSEMQIDMGFGFDNSTGTNVYCSAGEVWPVN